MADIREEAESLRKWIRVLEEMEGSLEAVRGRLEVSAPEVEEAGASGTLERTAGALREHLTRVHQCIATAGETVQEVDLLLEAAAIQLEQWQQRCREVRGEEAAEQQAP